MGYNAVDLATAYASGTTYRQVAVDSLTGMTVWLPGTRSTVCQSFPVQVGMQTTWSEGSYDPELAWSDFGYLRENPTDSAAAVTGMASGVRASARSWRWGYGLRVCGVARRAG